MTPTAKAVTPPITRQITSTTRTWLLLLPSKTIPIIAGTAGSTTTRSAPQRLADQLAPDNEHDDGDHHRHHHEV